MLSGHKRDYGHCSKACDCLMACCRGHGRNQRQRQFDGRWWSLKPCEKLCSSPCMGLQALDTLGLAKRSVAFAKASTGANKDGMWLTSTSGATNAQHTRAPQTGRRPSFSSFQWAPRWKEWGLMFLGHFPFQKGVTGTSSQPWTTSRSGLRRTACQTKRL